MRKLTGWLGLTALFFITYVPPLSTMSVWKTELSGIPLQALIWLVGPIFALACVWLIINSSDGGVEQ